MKKLIPIIISAALLFTIAQFKDSGPMEIENADAWGLMMGAAITGSGGAACSNNPTTDFVGLAGDITGGGGFAPGIDSMYCNLRTLTDMTCDTGTLSYGVTGGYYVTTAAEAKVCVYEASDATPQAGDALVGCTNAITLPADTAQWTTSSGEAGGTVTKNANYWVCQFQGGNTAYLYRLTSGETAYYRTASGSFATPPSTMGETWNSTASRNVKIYIKVK